MDVRSSMPPLVRGNLRGLATLSLEETLPTALALASCSNHLHLKARRPAPDSEPHARA